MHILINDYMLKLNVISHRTGPLLSYDIPSDNLYRATSVKTLFLMRVIIRVVLRR